MTKLENDDLETLKLFFFFTVSVSEREIMIIKIFIIQFRHVFITHNSCDWIVICFRVQQQRSHCNNILLLSLFLSAGVIVFSMRYCIFKLNLKLFDICVRERGIE